MQRLIFSLLSATSGQVRADFIKKTQQVSTVQEQFLRSLLQDHQDTQLGRHYNLSKIQSVDQFRDQIPVLPYSSYEPYIERVAQGELNVLTPDPVIYLNLTSGSTGNQKLVPVTRRSLRAVGKANKVSTGFLIQAAQKHGFPLGKMLLTTSAKLLGQTSGGIDYGHVSGGSLRLTNPLQRQIFTQPFEALLISNSLTRNYVCLLFALKNPHLAAIGANFPVLALQMCDYLERYADDLIQDLERGAIADWLDLEPELRLKLERKWSPSPKRAADLRQVLKSEKRLTPKLAWPNLSFVVTARGGTSDFYFERFPYYFGDTPIFGGTYSSSEATFGVHYDLNTDGTILAIESGFFEFISEDQWESEHPQTLLPHEVEVGKHYRILVTNYSGFYRYDVGDVVEVVGWFQQAPLIVFRYRRGGLLSCTVEKTTEHHAVQVMQALQQEFGVLLEDFCITLSEAIVAAHYVLNIELAPGQTLETPQKFLKRFDEMLQAANTSYALKRPKNDIYPPQLRILAPGSFAALRQRQQRQGVPNLQMKFPHISDDRKLLAGLRVEQEFH